VIIATGSEVPLAEAAADILAAEGHPVRVVSMPCAETFLEQDGSYRSDVLGSGIPVVSIEAGVTAGWERFTGGNGLRIGIDRFGASAPAGDLAREFGFTPEAVAERISAWIAAS
jgi:transketolase